MSNKKQCNSCFKFKKLSKFSRSNINIDGLQYVCKKCQNENRLKRSRTKLGVVGSIYSHQRASSLRRCHEQPSYTKNELKDWLYSQQLFHELYDEWVLSNYNRECFPSVDRKEDSFGYSFKNIQLMSWSENKIKSEKDRVSGKLISNHKSVSKFDLRGVFLTSYLSASLANRESGVDTSSIIKCCKGKRLKAGGFIWKYKDIT